MNETQDSLYAVPARFRASENLHIVFWLLKDLSWAMLWRPIGMLMIVPTLFLAIRITWQTRYIKSELFHNLAVVFWICANCTWMTTEFFWPLNEGLRYYTAIPFSIGFAFIGWYYLVIIPSMKRKASNVSNDTETAAAELEQVVIGA